MAVHEPSIGRGLLFYRSFIQLLGGAGFIILSLAVIGHSNGKTAYLLYGTESTGERLKPSIIETARSIWKVYIGVAIFSFIYLVIGTHILLPSYSLADNIFDSVNHAMAAQSTGGFSTLDDSIAGYHSVKMEILYLFPMILGSFSLPFYFKVIFDRQVNQFWKNLQTRSIIILCIAGSIILSLMLMNYGEISEPFRIGTFQFVSALTTTGWQTSDVHTWDSPSVVFIVMAGMIVGGAAGATVGGIKIIRVLMIFKGLFWHVATFFSSDNSIKVVRFNEKRLLPEEMNKELASAATFAFIYLLFVLISTFITYDLILSLALLFVTALFWRFSPNPSPEKKTAFPWRSLLTRPVFWIVLAVFTMGATAMNGLYNITPLFLIHERGFDLETANRLLGYTRAGGFIAILLAGLIIDRLGAKPVMLGTLLIAGLSTIALAEVRTFGWIVAVMLLQASIGVVIFPTMLFAISRMTTLHERGPFTSLAMGIAILVSVGVSPVFMGAIADRWSFEVGILLVGVATTLSCLLLRWIPKI